MADQQQLKEQVIEIEKLKAEQALTTESHGCEDRGPSKKLKHDSRDLGSIRTDALWAGKQLAICDLLWIEPMAMSYLAVQENDKVPNELAELKGDHENLEELEKAKQQAQLMYKKLLAHLWEHVSTDWFQERVRVFKIYYTWLTVII